MNLLTALRIPPNAMDVQIKLALEATDEIQKCIDMRGDVVLSSLFNKFWASLGDILQLCTGQSNYITEAFGKVDKGEIKNKMSEFEEKIEPHLNSFSGARTLLFDMIDEAQDLELIGLLDRMWATCKLVLGAYNQLFAVFDEIECNPEVIKWFFHINSEEKFGVSSKSGEK